MITTLEDFRTYKLAMELAEEVWSTVVKWSYFEKDTIGKQFVRAVDSISSNLSEGLGRYHYRETRNFAYYSRGSLFETKTWLTKCRNRGLLSDDQFMIMMEKVDTIGKMINTYINSLGEVKEPLMPYYTTTPSLEGTQHHNTPTPNTQYPIPNAQCPIPNA